MKLPMKNFRTGKSEIVDAPESEMTYRNGVLMNFSRHSPEGSEIYSFSAEKKAHLKPALFEQCLTRVMGSALAVGGLMQRWGQKPAIIGAITAGVLPELAEKLRQLYAEPENDVTYCYTAVSTGKPVFDGPILEEDVYGNRVFSDSGKRLSGR